MDEWTRSVLSSLEDRWLDADLPEEEPDEYWEALDRLVDERMDERWGDR